MFQKKEKMTSRAFSGPACHFGDGEEEEKGKAYQSANRGVER